MTYDYIFCLEKDGSNKCQPEKTNYAYTLNNNEITCNGDLNNECQQDVCMCDKAFADNVSEHEVCLFVYCLFILL